MSTAPGTGYFRAGGNVRPRRLISSLGPAMPPAEPPEIVPAIPVTPALAMSAAQARASGYTGDQCTNCNSMRMRVAGHCLCCDECGTTTGCS